MTFVASSTRLKQVIVGIVVATAIAPPIFAQNEQSQGDDQSRGVRIIDAPTPAPTNGPTPDDALTKTQPASSAKAQPATPASTPTLTAPSDEAVSKPTLVPPPDTALSKAPTPILTPAPDATQSKVTPTPNLTPAPDTAQSKAIPVPPPPDTVSKTTPVPSPSTPKPSQAIALPKSTMPPTAKTTAPLPTTAPADSSDFTPHKTAPAPSSPAKLEPASSSPILAPSSAPSALPAAEPSVSPPAVNDIAALPPRPAGSENPPTAALLEGLSQSIKVANSAELNVEILPGTRDRTGLKSIVPNHYEKSRLPHSVRCRRNRKAHANLPKSDVLDGKGRSRSRQLYSTWKADTFAGIAGCTFRIRVCRFAAAWHRDDCGIPQ